LAKRLKTSMSVAEIVDMLFKKRDAPNSPLNADGGLFRL
jgi:hypothetical protein